jgi:hypothetical protein
LLFVSYRVKPEALLDNEAVVALVVSFSKFDTRMRITRCSEARLVDNCFTLEECSKESDDGTAKIDFDTKTPASEARDPSSVFFCLVFKVADKAGKR